MSGANRRVVSFDGNNINDGTNYTATIPGLPGFPEVRYKTNQRSGAMTVPGSMTYRDQYLDLLVSINNSANADTLIEQLSEWFNPRGNEAKQLVIEDSPGGTNDRYWEVLPVSMDPIPNTGRLQWRIRVLVDGTNDMDGRLTGVTQNSTTWDVSATGDQQVVNNTGEDEGYPLLEIRPDLQKSSDGWTYRQFIPVIWNGDNATIGPYPIDIMAASWDTAALISGGKVRSDGQDVRVDVNGVTVDFWRGNWNTTTSRLWVNLQWPRGQYKANVLGNTGTGANEFWSFDTIKTIYPGGGYYGPIWPAEGYALIDSEIVHYQNSLASGGDSTQTNGIYVDKRGLFGTTAAVHTSGATIYLIHNEIFVYYGNPASTADQVGDYYKPVFNIDTSTNGSHVYANMRNQVEAPPIGGGTSDSTVFPTPTYRPRLSDWLWKRYSGYPRDYTGDQDGASTNPAQELGIHVYDPDDETYPASLGSVISAWWQLYSPYGITNANFTNGHRWIFDHTLTNVGQFGAFIMTNTRNVPYANTIEYTIPAPTASQTWQTWTQNLAFSQKSLNGDPLRYPTYLRFYAWGYNGSVSIMNGVAANFKVEFSDVTITHDSTYLPTFPIQGSEEAAAYRLDCSIINTTTGEQIYLKWLGKIGETVIVDCKQKTVVDQETGANVLAGLALGGATRRDWLTLQPGNNTLQYDEANCQDLRILVKWNNRYYD